MNEKPRRFVCNLSAIARLSCLSHAVVVCVSQTDEQSTAQRLRDDIRRREQRTVHPIHLLALSANRSCFADAGPTQR